MSKYEEMTHGCNVICPYCCHEYQPESEDYSEDRRTEQCGECMKYYHLNQIFDVTHETTPDCALNGDRHTWEPLPIRNGATHDFCAVCNKCRRGDED